TRLGDLTWVGYNLNLLLLGRLFIGDPLADVQREAEASLDFARQFRFRLVLDVATAILGFVRTLRGLTQEFGSFNDTEFDEGRFEHHLAEDPRLSNAARWYWVRKLQARFYAARGFEEIAHLYLGNARRGYLLWGADGKVRQLDQLHPPLRQDEGAPGPTGTIAAPVEHLDLATVLKVSQAVSGEIVQEK